MKRVLILGAAGRDFHNFNVLFRNNPDYQVVAFTATQIPDIAGRRYPPELAGRLYPEGIPIFEEKDLESLIAEYKIDAVVFSYSDISHQNLMHLASRAVAADADFWLLGTGAHADQVVGPGHFGVRGANWMRQEPGLAPGRPRVAPAGPKTSGHSASHALRRSCGAGCAALRHHGGSRPSAMHHRGTRRV